MYSPPLVTILLEMYFLGAKLEREKREREPRPSCAARVRGLTATEITFPTWLPLHELFHISLTYLFL